MAFGKKKSKDDEAVVSGPPVAGDTGPVEAVVPDGVIGSAMFAGDAGAGPEAETIGAELDGEALEGDAPPAEGAPEAEAAPASDPLGGDLLSMFQTTTLEADDKSALLELAGEVEFDDLLEELQTVRAALAGKRG